MPRPQKSEPQLCPDAAKFAADKTLALIADHDPSLALTPPAAVAVEDEMVERYLDQRVIGERIRALRLNRGFGLIELGTRTGLSASFLSQLETGRVIPTLRNLARIALAFGKDLSWFFRDAGPVKFRTLRREDRVPLVLERKQQARFLSQSLSALIPDRSLVPCIAEFHPAGGVCEFVPTIFSGQEFVYLMEGEIELTTPRGSNVLAAGDIAWVDGRTHREYHCSGQQTARAMIMTFPRQ
jgi:transcriptional regulator with XRE-family HTH domain